MNSKAAAYPYLYAFRADDALATDLDDAIAIYGDIPMGTATRLLLEEPEIRAAIRRRADAYRVARALNAHYEQQSAGQAERTETSAGSALQPPR